MPVLNFHFLTYKLNRKNQGSGEKMEKTMTVEEKIRRAEEIYNRRNGNNYTYQNYSQKSKKGPSLMQRMIKQIIICFMIYGIFYIVTNREYYLSHEFKNQIENKASQNEVTKKAYNWLNEQIPKCINQINQFTKKEEKQTEQTKNEEQQVEETTSEVKNQTEISQTINEENIGGATEETAQIEKTQEEKDVEKIKNTINFIKPIDGTISSTFGWRTPTTATVPKYHTGLDIAAKTGTKIKSATNGKVILASSEGDYGKHYKIQVDDIIIIYAHCSKLYLNEGDNVWQGQEIAEVGSTGNSTRATLTF